jgi:hypothetical protein
MATLSNDTRLLEQFQKRYKKAQGVADLWASLHQECYHYAIPNRNRFWRPKEQQGELRGSRVFDTTAIESTKTFVSKMHTAMTPPQTQWGYLELDDNWDTENIVDKENAQIILDNYMRKLFAYIHDSNFDVVINECYFDLAVGTACLVINSHNDKQPLMFTSVPMDKLAIEEAMTGKCESWYRNWEDVKINEITKRWTKAVVPDAYMALTKDDPDAVVRMVYEGVMYVPTEAKPYCYVVCADDAIFYKEYLELNPGIVWRFQKTNNDVFGRGPVMDALPSIVSLNEMARIELASANLNVFKPFMGFSDAVFNPHTFTMQPMSIIPIAPIGADGQAPLIPLPDTSNPQFAQLTIMDLRGQIQRLLFADSPVPTDSRQPPSATELMVNQQLLAERIGPLFSRLQQEFLFPVVSRCMYILDKMGLLPKPKIKGNALNFQYRSPLALAKGQEQIARFTQFYQILQGINGPDMAQMYVNPAVFPFVMADLMQIDSRFLNTPEGVQQAAQNLQNKVNESGGMVQQGQESAPPPQQGT